MMIWVRGLHAMFKVILGLFLLSGVLYAMSFLVYLASLLGWQ